MIRDRALITGSLSWVVRDKDGNVKRAPQTWLDKLLNREGREYKGINHNIVTDEGDAMIADLMSETPGETKVDGTNGYVEVGSGFVSAGKGSLSCTTPEGTPELMDAGYPQMKGTFGAANDNVVVYKALFEAGDLNATIDEAALLNNVAVASAEALAYAAVTPDAVVSSSDTLEITWELTILGA